jgi:hypothetical protein
LEQESIMRRRMRRSGSSITETTMDIPRKLQYFVNQICRHGTTRRRL